MEMLTDLIDLFLGLGNNAISLIIGFLTLSAFFSIVFKGMKSKHKPVKLFWIVVLILVIVGAIVLINSQNIAFQ